MSLPGQAARWSVFIVYDDFYLHCLVPCSKLHTTLSNTGKLLDNKDLELDNSVASYTITIPLWCPVLWLKVPRQKVLNIPAAGASWLELAQAAAGEMCLEVFARRCE